MALALSPGPAQRQEVNQQYSSESVFSVECGLLRSRPTRPQQSHAEVAEEACGAWEALQSVFQELSSAIFYMKPAGNHSK